MNMGKAIEDSVKKYGDKIAIIDEAKEKRLSFKDIDRLTNNLAACLLQKGIKKGDHLAIFMIDSWEYAISYYAIHKIGAVCFPFSLWAKEGELKNCFKHFLPVAVVTSPEYQELFNRMKSDVPSLKNIVIASEALKIDARRVPPAEIDEDDPSIGLYLSYAPDRPRCSMHPFKYVGCFYSTFQDFLGVDENSVWLESVLLCRGSGRSVLYFPLLFGSTTVIYEIASSPLDFDPRKWLKCVEKNKVNFFWIPPITARTVLWIKEEIKNYDLSNLKAAMLMGAYSPPELCEEFGLAMGLGRPSYQLYAGTEMAIVAMEKLKAKYRPGSVGIPVKGVEVKIVDQEGKELPRGQVGEIIVRSPVLMSCYYKDPEATAERIRDGWFYTYDLGKFDQDGYLYITGRKQERMVVAGMKIYYDEIIPVLNSHPKIKESQVIGIPDKMWEQTIKAFVVLKEGEEANSEEIIQYCRQKLGGAGIRAPRIIEFVKKLPESQLGKTIRWDK